MAELDENNKCIKHKCNAGNNEKCLDCNNEEGKENECLNCNEGYYLPLNSFDKTLCKKCEIEKCKICNNNGICQECKSNYEAVINNEKIIECIPICELGQENKCLTCENKNKCGSCNLGYKLMKNGKCKKIENSFIATFNVKSIYQDTYIMNIYENQINLSNIEVYLNNSRIFPYSINMEKYYPKNIFICYKFPKIGMNTIKVVINQTLSRMSHFFRLCSELVNVSFAEEFDTSHVKAMDEVFFHCDLLENINVSSFNTNLVSSFFQTFGGCPKLTSVDLSSFEGRYSCDFIFMFIAQGNLIYIDLSSFYSIYPECNRINLLNSAYNGVTGTVIANRKLIKIETENNWKIIYKD